MVQEVNIPNEPLNPVPPVPSKESQKSPETKESVARPSPSVPSSSEWYNRFIRGCQKVQRYSSYSFTAFLVLHGVTVVTPIVSVKVADETLQFTRAVYQTNLIEPLVFGSMAVHVISGSILRINRIMRRYKYYEQFKVNIGRIPMSGYALVTFLMAHVVLNRFGPVSELGDSSMINFDYVAQQFHHNPWLSWLAYVPLVILSSYHVISGWKIWLAGSRGSLATKLFRKKNWAVAATSALGITSLVILSRVEQVTGWVANQYTKVFTSLNF